jgi:hypothetical protein
MADNPFDAVGIVHAHEGTGWDAKGSCFLFRSDVVALTAAHVVPTELEPYAVSLPQLGGKVLSVERIERHPAPISRCCSLTVRTHATKEAFRSPRSGTP